MAEDGLHSIEAGNLVEDEASFLIYRIILQMKTFMRNHQILLNPRHQLGSKGVIRAEQEEGKLTVGCTQFLIFYQTCLFSLLGLFVRTHSQVTKAETSHQCG